MRIVGGQFRGTNLSGLGKGDIDAHLRPTTDRTRESLFNLLINGASGDLVSGRSVLDLFAGTGALGLEAISRGAIHACFVDSGKKALTLIQQNCARCHVEDRSTIIARDATKLGPTKSSFDLVFCDPPYGKGMGDKALQSAIDNGWIAKGAVVVLEEGQSCVPPAGLIEHDQRRYGDSFIHIWAYPA